MGGRGPAQPHRQAAGPGPQPPERGGGDIREGADPRPSYRSAAPPPPQGLFRPSLPSTGGGGGEGEGREEGGREGRREGEDGEGGGAGHICGWLVVHGRLRHVVQKG